MSQPPDPQQPVNLLCSHRALFGVNSSAEIIAWRLTHEAGHPAASVRFGVSPGHLALCAIPAIVRLAVRKGE